MSSDGSKEAIACKSCGQRTTAYRESSRDMCVWCQWADPTKRASARYQDKVVAERRRKKKAEASSTTYRPRLEVGEVSREQFIAWYVQQPDRCHYCGTTRDEIRELALRRGGFGYFVSWDIDRKDSSKGYQPGNMALSCFLCNMAKGNHFSEQEALVLGRAIRTILEARLSLARAGNP
jgi:hypothetical protein